MAEPTLRVYMNMASDEALLEVLSDLIEVEFGDKYQLMVTSNQDANQLLDRAAHNQTDIFILTHRQVSHRFDR